MARVALIGQPNCGKSTLFNQVAGYRSEASNFPGTTVSYTKSRVRIDGEEYELIDLPGLYSLSSCEKTEEVARDYLLSGEVDLIVNIIDASTLSRSLELTIELLELGIAMVVCLNMMDEAKRKGIEIDVERLSRALGLPVVGTIANKGIGVKELFQEIKAKIENPDSPEPLLFSKDIEGMVQELEGEFGDRLKKEFGIKTRLVVLKAVEGDESFQNKIFELVPDKKLSLKRIQSRLQESHGRDAFEVICAERHSLAMKIFEEVARVLPRKRPLFMERIDQVVLHKYYGYLILAFILFIFFNLIFYVGKFVEEPTLKLFDSLSAYIELTLGKNLIGCLTLGLIQGLSGGIGIVLPYLVPFVIGLSLLEDIGYLPRAAFLMDNFMHKIGLHGKAVIPFVIGYGCNVPAVMATRNLESPRDRFIASALVAMIPCSARTIVIFGLVAFFLGPLYALFIYFFNLFIIAIIGKVLTKLLPEFSPGLIMEVPAYRVPSFSALMFKTWARLKEFIGIAFPLIIAGSIVLSMINFFQLDKLFNKFLSPLVSGILGLPSSVGVTLVFGILRKELALVMLAQALGSYNFIEVMSLSQIFIFTVFVTFYVPCLGTVAGLWREVGIKKTVMTFLLTIIVALVVSVLFRLVFYFFPLPLF